MYLGRFKFIIEKDTSQVLLPCDIIESLTFGFTVGKNALFRIWRNNILYPDEKKVYNLKPIESIRITRNNIFDVEKKKDDNLPVKKSIEKLYAWHTEGMYPAFSEESITKNSDALYEIDIEKMTYSINPKFKTKIYKNRDIDIFNELKESCDIIQGKQKISCSINLISNGTLCIENCISGNFILQINQKAKISL